MRRSGALESLERIMLVVPWLLEHEGAAIDDVCTRFGLRRDDLMADLDVLGYCGLPGYGGGDLVQVLTDGEHVTVRLAEAFRRPLRLSTREALTLVLAARAVERLPGLAAPPALRSARERLETALGATAPVAISLEAEGDEHLPELRGALRARRVVRLVYRAGSSHESSERDVEPWELRATAGAWYLHAYCRSARAPRWFRLDRIERLVVREERAPTPPADRPAPPPAYRPSEGDEVVVLHVQRPAAWLLERLVVEEVEEAGDGVRATLRAPALEGIARLVLSQGGAVRVVAPPRLAERVAELARATLARYAPDGE